MHLRSSWLRAHEGVRPGQVSQVIGRRGKGWGFLFTVSFFYFWNFLSAVHSVYFQNSVYLDSMIHFQMETSACQTQGLFFFLISLTSSLILGHPISTAIAQERMQQCPPPKLLALGEETLIILYILNQSILEFQGLIHYPGGSFNI